MDTGNWLWIIPAGALLTGIILAVTTTTSNKWRWAVIAPLAFGAGTLALAVIYGDWGPIAVSGALFLYAAINYRNLRKESGTDGRPN